MFNQAFTVFVVSVLFYYMRYLMKDLRGELINSMGELTNSMGLQIKELRGELTNSMGELTNSMGELRLESKVLSDKVDSILSHLKLLHDLGSVRYSEMQQFVKPLLSDDVLVGTSQSIFYKGLCLFMTPSHISANDPSYLHCKNGLDISFSINCPKKMFADIKIMNITRCAI